MEDDREFDAMGAVAREGELGSGGYELDVNARQRLAVARIKMGEVEEGKVSSLLRCQTINNVKFGFIPRCTRISFYLMMSSSMLLFLQRLLMRISSGICSPMHVPFMNYLELMQGCVYLFIRHDIATPDHTASRQVVSTSLCRRLPVIGCWVI